MQCTVAEELGAVSVLGVQRAQNVVCSANTFYEREESPHRKLRSQHVVAMYNSQFSTTAAHETSEARDRRSSHGRGSPAVCS
jgi:hypothetical protein